MTKCSRCGKKIDGLPFKCRYCGKDYCDDHRLPEDHECKDLEEYKKGNQKRWQEAVKSEFSPKKHYRKSKPYRHNRYRKHRPRRAKDQSGPRHKISTSSKLKKFLWKNKGLIKVLIIIIFAFLLIQYYGNNQEQINSYLNNSVNGLKNTYEDFTTPYSVSHEGPINKSYVVKSTRLNKITLTLHKSVYDYFVNDAPHEYSYSSYSSYSEPPAGWEKDYWTMFLTNKNDEYVIDDIINQTVKATNDDGDIAVRTLVRFVQGIPYDWNSYNSIYTNVKYPYETLYLNKGVCADKSLLLTKLLTKLGYGVALFNYDAENHMAVGIACPYDKSNFKSGYCFIESTDYYVIGQIPGNYVGGADIRNATPEIIVVSEGKVYSG